MKQPIEVIVQREETKRILELAQEAQNGVQEIRQRTRLAIDAARKCGYLLLQEKRWVKREMGHGYWDSYYEANFSKVLPIRTATDWMRKYSKTAIADSTTDYTEELNEPEKQAVLHESNDLRTGMLALDLFPKKSHIAIEGNAPAPKLNASYLSHVAWLEDWIADLKESTVDQPLTPDRIIQLQGDFRKLSKFCMQLNSSPEDEPICWAKNA